MAFVLILLLFKLILGTSYVLTVIKTGSQNNFGSSLKAGEFEGFKESINNLLKSNPLFAPFLSDPALKETIPTAEKFVSLKPLKKIVSIDQVVSDEAKQLNDQINYYCSILEPAIKRDSSKPLPKQLINNSLKEIEKLLGQKYRLEAQLYEKYSNLPEDDTFTVDRTSLSTYTSSADKMFESLEGAWRLIYTTGTKELQQTFSNDTFINYFPLKAVQSFSYKTGSDQSNVISNGIYWNTFPIIQFEGNFLIESRLKKVIFDFGKVKLFNVLTIPISSYNATDFDPTIGVTERLNKKPFFKWILADKAMGIARGRGGGLAMWCRDEEMQQILLPSNTIQQ